MSNKRGGRYSAARYAALLDGIADVSVEVEGLDAIVAALRAEADGKALRRELARDMRTALRPAVADAKASILGMSSAGLSTAPALRPAVAKRIGAQVRLSGRSTGARVKARKLPETVRGFRNAPKLLNRAKWRHPGFGGDDWYDQEGKPGWFDDPMRRHGAKYREAVLGAMENMARRISRRSRG